MGKHHYKLGLNRILCASQFTIPVTAGGTADPAGIHTDTRSSKPNLATHTPCFLIFTRIIPTFIPHLSFLSTTLSSLQKTKLSHPSQSLHAMIMSKR